MSRFFTILGALLLSHACYSAHEFSSLNSNSLDASIGKSTSIAASLPLDISLETIASVLIICVGLVLGAEKFKPISWRVWAGGIESDQGGAGPFEGLESRVGFLDIRAKRKEFADWVREGDEGSKK
ncbi:hypothetical protein MMC12_002668 [Toensbergia leucococca]|nr:hypothetical protein [Toensbergia leucococca]